MTVDDTFDYYANKREEGYEVVANLVRLADDDVETEDEAKEIIESIGEHVVDWMWNVAESLRRIAEE